MSDYERTPEEMDMACRAGHHTPVVIETITLYSFSTAEPTKILRRTRNILECSFCSEPLFEVPIDVEVGA